MKTQSPLWNALTPEEREEYAMLQSYPTEDGQSRATEIENLAYARSRTSE